MITDLAQFNKRVYISPGGNRGVISTLGPGGIHVQWHTKPTKQDLTAFNAWLTEQIGPLEVETHLGLDRTAERTAYERWKRTQG